MTGDGVNDARAFGRPKWASQSAQATDVAKGAASVVLTEPGLTNIVALVEQDGRSISAILTWIVNKISRTILKAAFVAIALRDNRQICRLRLCDAAVGLHDGLRRSLSGHRPRRSSQKPETWKIGGFILVSAALGIAYGRGNARPLMDLLVAFRFSDQTITPFTRSAS